MNISTIRKINALNAAFYRENHQSFSASRAKGWDGWSRVCKHLGFEAKHLRLLDLGCGNMRFERYVNEHYPQASCTFTCVDSSTELPQHVENAEFLHADIIEELLADRFPATDTSPYDAVVSFGFMHHVPSSDLRRDLMRHIIESLAPGGTAALSFWQFQLDPARRAKAERTTEHGIATTGLVLEEGDYLLGWNEQPDSYRYCHGFSNEEIDDLLESVREQALKIDRFNADGKSANLNQYIVLRRLPTP